MLRNEVVFRIFILIDMKKIVYYLVLILSVLAVPLSIFAIINTMVSVKYETEYRYGGSCISLVSGDNLCTIILFWKIMLIISILLILLLLI